MPIATQSYIHILAVTACLCPADLRNLLCQCFVCVAVLTACRSSCTTTAIWLRVRTNTMYTVCFGDWSGVGDEIILHDIYFNLCSSMKNLLVIVHFYLLTSFHYRKRACTCEPWTLHGSYRIWLLCYWNYAHLHVAQIFFCSGCHFTVVSCAKLHHLHQYRDTTAICCNLQHTTGQTATSKTESPMPCDSKNDEIQKNTLVTGAKS